MGGLLLTTEIVLGVCLLGVLAFLVVTAWRRRAILRSGDVCLCAVRENPEARWQPGLLRLAPDTLDWFPLFGLTSRPHCRWARTTLELTMDSGGGPQTIEHPLLGTALLVPFRAVEEQRGVVQAQMAMAMDRYTAVRAWVEAAPPGARPVG